MTNGTISAFKVLDDLEYILEVLAKNYIGEAKTELSTLTLRLENSDIPGDILLKLQWGLIEGHRNISGARFDVVKCSHYLWDAYKQLKNHMRSSQSVNDFQQAL